MATVLYANAHQNFSSSGTITVFIFGEPGEQVNITSRDGFSDSGTIGTDGSLSMSVPQSLAMSGTGINNQGLRISSDGEISAYVSNRQTATTDLTVVFDETSLGNEYMIASAGDSISDGGQFSAQSIQDGTVLTFVLPDGQTADIELSAGETFKFSTTDFAGNSALGINVAQGVDLTGTSIFANNPLAVFSGHSCTRVGIGDQPHLSGPL